MPYHGRVRLRAKRDANHSQIVEELRSCGVSVFDMGAVGKGFPDLVVGYKNETYLVEIKTLKGTLTDHQLRFAERWRGGPIIIARTTEEVLGAIEAH